MNTDINILSIETSGKNCSVSLTSNNVFLYYRNIEEPNQHDKLLAVLVKEAMRVLDNNYKELDAVAVSSGPGSFTGLRIGASLAKGLTYDEKIRLIAVPTMEAIAHFYVPHITNYKKKKLIALVKSHKNFYYIQEFDKNFTKSGDLELINLDNLKYDEKTLYVGPGGKILAKDIYDLDLYDLNSKMIAGLANKLYIEKNFVTPENFVPHYAQDFIPK